MAEKRGQAGIEYLIIIGFVTFALIGILGIAMYYSGSIRDRIRSIQIGNCADKIIESSESVFYSGYPSRTTVLCYLPENVKSMEVIENSLIFTYRTNSGVSKTAFSSNVPLSGNISSFSGSKKIRISAEQNFALISAA